MTSKKKKIIILTGMVALLVLTGVLNIVLNLTADNALEVSGTDVYMDFFTSYRDYRAESREQTLLYYDELLASDNLSAQAREEAEAARLQLMEDMETETALEGIIKGLGFEDAIVTSTTENINVIVKCAELTGTQATQIKEVVMTETGSTALNIRIIPTE
ncbi:MAG TPA: SpoIIIAH-like family protein [Firmicutes bacterium]|nr:SpoIIIAH-like family protein [Bacillota bacterium]